MISSTLGIWFEVYDPYKALCLFFRGTRIPQIQAHAYRDVFKHRPLQQFKAHGIQ